MNEKKLEITRRKFLKASGKVAGVVASKGGKVRGVGELIMPQEAPKSGIGHVYQKVFRDIKGQIVGYGDFLVQGSKTEHPVRRQTGNREELRKTGKLEYLGELDTSEFVRDYSDIPEGKIREHQYITHDSRKPWVLSDFDEISMSLNEQIEHEDQSDWEFADEAHMDEIGPRESAPEHPFDSDEYGQRVKRLSQTTRKLSEKLMKSHWLQDQAKKQIRSRSQRLLEHQNQQKQIQSQKKPSQTKQKITQAIDLAKESPKTSSIISGLSRFSGVLAGLELADANPFNPPKLGAPGIEEWKRQEEARKKKLVVR